MSDPQVPLPDLNATDPGAMGDVGYADEEQVTRTAHVGYPPGVVKAVQSVERLKRRQARIGPEYELLVFTVLRIDDVLQP